MKRKDFKNKNFNPDLEQRNIKIELQGMIDDLIKKTSGPQERWKTIGYVIRHRFRIYSRLLKRINKDQDAEAWNIAGDRALKIADIMEKRNLL